MVHERRVKETGEVLKMKVSGQVRLGNLIMYDEESGSTWLQETGASIDGQRQGQCLTPMQPEQWKEQVRWDEWKREHPNSKVLVCHHCEGKEDF